MAFVHSTAVSSVCSSLWGWGAGIESMDKCPPCLPVWASITFGPSSMLWELFCKSQLLTQTLLYLSWPLKSLQCHSTPFFPTKKKKKKKTILPSLAESCSKEGWTWDVLQSLWNSTWVFNSHIKDERKAQRGPQAARIGRGRSLLPHLLPGAPSLTTLIVILLLHLCQSRSTEEQRTDYEVLVIHVFPRTLMKNRSVTLFSKRLPCCRAWMSGDVPGLHSLYPWL